MPGFRLWALLWLGNSLDQALAFHYKLDLGKYALKDEYTGLNNSQESF